MDITMLFPMQTGELIKMQSCSDMEPKVKTIVTIPVSVTHQAMGNANKWSARAMQSKQGCSKY